MTDDSANSDAGEAVTMSRDNGIARVRLNRPLVRNAVNLETCLAIQTIFATLEADADVRIVLIGGNGPVFCAGADLKERQGKTADWVRDRRLSAFAAYAAIERCRVPVISLVHGTVVGSGGEISLASDFIIAAEGTVFRFPEPQWGTVGATQRLQRAIGKRRAKELLYTGRELPAEEAHALGMVGRIVPSAQLLEAGDEIASRIMAAPARAIELTKRAIDEGEETTLSKGIEAELRAIDENLAGGDWQAGVARFNQGKPSGA